MTKHNFKWLNNIWVSKSAIMGSNAMLAPFALPVIVWLVVCQCYSALLAGGAGAVGGAAVLTCLGLLPCALLYAVGLAGAVYCCKSMLVDGEMDIRKRFARGIRKNALKYMLFVFIMWLSAAIAVFTPAVYSFMGIGILYGIGLAVSVFQLIITVPAMCLAIMQCAYYDDKLKNIFCNSFKLYFMRPLRTIGTTLLCALPFCICVILPFVVQLVFWVLYSVIGVAIGIVFYLRYAKKFFDDVVSGTGETQDLAALCKDDPAPVVPIPQTAENHNE